MRRYRVLINAIHSKSGGGRVYLHEVIPRLSRMDSDMLVRVVARATQASELEPLGLDVRVANAPESPALSLLWDQLALPAIAAMERSDLVFTPANFGPVVLGRRSVILLRNTFEAATAAIGLSTKIRWHASDIMTRVSVRTADGGLAVSGAFRELVSRRHGVPADRIHVIHHGYSEIFRPAPGPGETDDAPSHPYLLTVSDVYPHKNLLRVLEGVRLARRQIPNARLLIAGSELHAEYAQRVRALAAAPELRDAVRFLGPQPQTRLPSLYRNATAVLCLSVAETFGISQVEAMACGAPLVVSDIPVFREVAGDAAVFVDPLDVTSISEAIRRVFASESLRSDLRRRSLQRASCFGWDRTATALHDQLLRRARETDAR
jgi:glycosyltransferase involved in cell wall biosynthesis